MPSKRKISIHYLSDTYEFVINESLTITTVIKLSDSSNLAFDITYEQVPFMVKQMLYDEIASD